MRRILSPAVDYGLFKLLPSQPAIRSRDIANSTENKRLLFICHTVTALPMVNRVMS